MLLSPSMTGTASADPLRQAFAAKNAPHAGRNSQPVTISELQWQQWWRQPSTAQQRTLYIHIPFCRKRCSFCNFFVSGSNPADISDYMQSITAQLTIAADTVLAQSRMFDAVYVGGGTPSDMSAEAISRLGQAIAKFPLNDDTEITLEGRLHGFDDDKWQAALSSGFNRFSFGVQSFETQVRQAAGRIDGRDIVIDRLKQLSQHPTASIVVDLIFGLPGQTRDIWQQDLAAVIQSNVHGVDLYQLIQLSGSLIDRASSKGEILGTDNSQFQADSQARAGMYASGAEFFESRQWQRLSSCHWRRDERERSRYNSLAKSGVETLPFGAGAGGNIHGHSLMNGRKIKAWRQALASDVSIATPCRVPGMVIAPNSSAAFDSTIKRGLDRGILPLDQLEQTMIEQLKPLFNAWQNNGLAILDRQHLKLTLAGRFWNVNLQTGLFDYLTKNSIRQ
ncbi:Anaerobilin synthase [Sinobacterium norvegicum]|uniref:Anaerobilin synthase n=1 Tax=Sinobacterium norvegicum TaxID=1641715 RepID=A0ABM9AF33_9GAMM|nr:heme anaerobic degradation radical SAM methyltransferase ChuW/HutW [Sinobacterium norvegicum]CAH0991567.1 Anaerobilin synthase [Sinobacterium norvegicum]